MGAPRRKQLGFDLMGRSTIALVLAVPIADVFGAELAGELPNPAKESAVALQTPTQELVLGRWHRLDIEVGAVHATGHLGGRNAEFVERQFRTVLQEGQVNVAAKPCRLLRPRQLLLARSPPDHPLPCTIRARITLSSSDQGRWRGRPTSPRSAPASRRRPGSRIQGDSWARARVRRTCS